MTCPLCNNKNVHTIDNDSLREYVQCRLCDLIFVPRSSCVGEEQERKRYDLHSNTINDAGYVRYLETVADYLRYIPLQKPETLDFGSGQNAILTHILNRRGIPCTAYDPLYDIGTSALSRKYDFVIMCEVIEHVRDLYNELTRIRDLLNDNGFVLIRTQMVKDIAGFTSWWYTKDITHINFFSYRTLEYVGDFLRRRVIYSDRKHSTIYGP